MRKSTAQKDFAGHTKQIRGPNVAHGPRVGQPWFNGFENNYLLVIYCLKYFFCKHVCEKKLCLTNQKPHRTPLVDNDGMLINYTAVLGDNFSE